MLKKCKCCRRGLREKNQSGFCQTCYTSIKQMMNYRNKNRTEEECVIIRQINLKTIKCKREKEYERSFTKTY